MRRRSSSSARARSAPRSCCTTASARTARPSQAKIAEQRGAALVPPFDHPHIIAGQGTLAFELGRTARARHLQVDASLRAVQRRRARRGLRARDQVRFAGCAVYAVEPRGLRGPGRIARGGRAPSACRPARRRSATDCRRHCRAPSRSRSIATSSRARSPSTTSRSAARWPWRREHLKVVLEPSGAAALAAVLAEPRPRGACIGVVLSGGNVDDALFADVLRTHGAH